MPSAAPPGIGNKLRRARLDRSLSIEETAWRTRIRPELLRALEEDDYASLGHNSFVRSHLYSYARFLGIDPAEVVDEFASICDDEPSSIQQLERQARVAKKPPRPKWLIAAGVSTAVLIAAAAVGLLGGQAERPVQDPLPLTALTAPPATEDQGPVPAAEARVRLRVEALRDASISVIADGAEVFEGTLAEGTVRTFLARDTIEILLADAGGVRLTLNDERLGSPGEPGHVFRGRYGPDGPLDA